MQRRSFLGALLGMAAAPVLARLAPAFEVPPASETFAEAPSILRPHNLGVIPGSGLLHRVSAYVGGDELYQPTAFNLCRADGTVLLRIVLNGHNMVWAPAPGQEIVFFEDAPLVLEAPPNVAVILTHSALDLDHRTFAATSIKQGIATTAYFEPQGPNRRLR